MLWVVLTKLGTFSERSKVDVHITRRMLFVIFFKELWPLNLNYLCMCILFNVLKNFFRPCISNACGRIMYWFNLSVCLYVSLSVMKIL
jgi:hypothetical protein